MKILYLEDHVFYGDEMYKTLHKELSNHTVDYATNYAQAESFMIEKSYDISLLDVILQNGRTGIHFAEQYQQKLGRILFITGCKDEPTLEALKHYEYIPKSTKSLNLIREFLRNYVK